MTPEPELSHAVRFDRIGTGVVTVTLAPNANTRARIAGRFELLSLDRFNAELTVRRRRDSGWIEVSGSVSAAVVQACVVTTDPVAAEVEAVIHELFDDSGAVDPDEIDIDPLADTPEPVLGDRLDVGEIAVQAFGLALDPYPRATPSTGPMTIVADDGPSVAPSSPFAKLAGLKIPGADAPSVKKT
jgi:uncharacterized metal-binding protein YceD (DUF177 family)